MDSYLHEKKSVNVNYSNHHSSPFLSKSDRLEVWLESRNQIFTIVRQHDSSPLSLHVIPDQGNYHKKGLAKIPRLENRTSSCSLSSYNTQALLNPQE